MSFMQLFKATYHLRSPVGLRSVADTAWQADTIFGHLCWALCYADGEDNLMAFLDLFREGDPPFVLSNGFPADFLPRPMMPYRPSPVGKKQAGVQAARANKEAGAVKWLTLEEFNRCLQGEMVVPRRDKDEKGLPSHRVTLKNQIGRLTNTTGGQGNLFDFAEAFYSSVSIYVRVADGFAEDAERLFRFVAQQGYGKRKSTGYGEIGSFDFKPFAGFGPPGGANGFVSLSNFVPARGDPTRGAWRTTVKYGRLGEEYALDGRPFKRPLVMLVAGSCFYDQPSRDYYGRLVKDVSASHPRVVQYGLALAVPALLPERGAP